MQTRINILLQARMSSSRLPGKVLKNLAGWPLVDWVIAQVGMVKQRGDIILATSSDASDDALAAHVAANPKAALTRGPLDDVYGRFCMALRAYPCSHFVRVNCDSPLMDPRMIDHAIALLHANPDADVITNIMPRSFPPGLSVELVRTGLFLECEARIDRSRDEHEHVTRHFYERSDIYRIVNFATRQSYELDRFCIDDQADFDALEKLIRARGLEPGGYSAFKEKCCA